MLLYVNEGSNLSAHRQCSWVTTLSMTIVVLQKHWFVKVYHQKIYVIEFKTYNQFLTIDSYGIRWYFTQFPNYLYKSFFQNLLFFPKIRPVFVIFFKYIKLWIRLNRLFIVLIHLNAFSLNLSNLSNKILQRIKTDKKKWNKNKHLTLKYLQKLFLYMKLSD